LDIRLFLVYYSTVLSLQQHPVLLVHQVPAHLSGIESNIQVTIVFGLQRDVNLLVAVTDRLLVALPNLAHAVNLPVLPQDLNGLQPPVDLPFFIRKRGHRCNDNQRLWLSFLAAIPTHALLLFDSSRGFHIMYIRTCINVGNLTLIVNMKNENNSLPELPDPGRYQLNKNVHNITRYQTIAADMQHRSLKPRLYMHVDMNAFYAQVEQLCYNLYNVPVAVGGWRKEDGTVKGIVATSSYEARAWGVRTGMSALEAYKLCPFIVFKQVDYDKYKSISRRIHKMLDTFSPDVEAYSMDEFFLDITWKQDQSYRQLCELGWDVKEAIYEETGLRCSVGISTSKTYAKLSSDLEKPDGLTVIRSQEAIRKQIWPLQLDEVWGIGRRRFKKIKSRGILTIGDAIDRGYPLFQKLFGSYFGKMLWNTVAGNDRATVSDDTDYVPKRVSYGHTFSTWTEDPWKVAAEFSKAVKQVCYRLRGYGKKSDHFFGTVRFQGPEKDGFSFTFRAPGLTNLDSYVLHHCLKKLMPMLFYCQDQGKRFRAIMLGTTELHMTTQMELFFQENPKMQRIYQAMDYINNRFGLDSIDRGLSQFDVKGNTHFKERSM